MHSFVCVVFLLVWGYSEAQSPAPLDYAKLQSTFNMNHALWASKGSKTYSMRYQVDCFCMPIGRDPVIVQVKNLNVTCAVYAKDAEVGRGKADVSVTIESMFSRVEKAIASRACELTVSYDPQLGYPSSVYIASSCGISDIPSYRISDVELVGGHAQHCGHHRGYRRHAVYCAVGGGVLLLVVISAVAACIVRRNRQHSQAIESVTKKVGDAKYLNLQEEEEVEVEPDTEMKKEPLV